MQFSPNRGVPPQQQQPMQGMPSGYAQGNGWTPMQGGSPYRNQPDQRVYGSGHASLLVKPSLIAHQPQPLSPPPQVQPRPRSPPGWIQQQTQPPAAAVTSPPRTLQSSPSEVFRSPFQKQPVGGRMQHSHSDAMLKTSPQPTQQSRQPPQPVQINRPSAKWLAEQEARKQAAAAQQQQQQQQPLSPSQTLPPVQAQSQPLSPQRQQSIQQAQRFPNQHLSPQQQLQAQRGANHAAVTSPSRLAPLLGYQTTSKVATAEMQAAAERQKAKEEHEAALRREQLQQQQQQQQEQQEQEAYEAAMAQQQWQQQVQDQLQHQQGQGQGQGQDHPQFSSPDLSAEQQAQQAAWEQHQAEAAEREHAQGQDPHSGNGQDQGPPSDPAAAEAYWSEQAEQDRYMQWLAVQEAVQRENAEAQAQPHHWQQPIGQPHRQPGQGQHAARGASFSLSPSSRAQQLSGGGGGGFGSTTTQHPTQSQSQVIAQPHTFLSWAPSRGNQGGTSLGISPTKRSTVHFTSPASLIQHQGQEDDRARFRSHMAESYAAPGGWRPPPPKLEPEVFRSNTEMRDNFKRPPEGGAGNGSFYAQRVSGARGASSAESGLPGAEYAARMAASFATKQRAENQYTGFGGALGPPQPRPTQISPTKFPTLNLRP